MADLVHSSFMIFGLITEPLPVKCRLNGGKANNYMQAVKDKDSSGFHVYLVAFTGKSLSKAFILTSTKPQYDKRFSLIYQFST